MNLTRPRMTKLHDESEFHESVFEFLDCMPIRGFGPRRNEILHAQYSNPRLHARPRRGARAARFQTHATVGTPPALLIPLCGLCLAQLLGAGQSPPGEYVCGEKLMSTHANAYHLT